MSEQEPTRRGLGPLYAGSFLGNFDRIVITPLLLPIAHGLHVGVAAATTSLTVYLLMFGLMQPVHGLLSDTVGRVRVMRWALLGLGAADLLAALAPNLGLLIAGRAVAGAAAAALMPVAVAYVGDRVPVQRRQRTVASLLAAGAVGTAGATVAAGVLTHVWSWRGAILLVAVLAPVLAVVFGRLPEASAPAPAPGAGGARAAGSGWADRLRRVAGIRWFRFLLALAFIEGAAMLGFFNFFNTALQSHGKSVLTAGLVTGSYGLAAVAGGLAVRTLALRLSSAALWGAGATLLLAGYLSCALSATMPGVLLGSVLAGLAFALVQSIVQTWATEVAQPADRGIATSMVACAVFTGAALSTWAVGGLASRDRFGLLFVIAAAVTVPVAVLGPIARARFTGAARTPAPAGAAGPLQPANQSSTN